MPPSHTPLLRLNKGQERRLKSGHPWAFSNEIAMRPEYRQMPPGAPVRVTLRAAGDHAELDVADSGPGLDADAVMKAPCASPASGSALPWPKRCSLSAGVKASRMAKRLSPAVKRSSAESARLASIATECDVK